jgi:2-polyprenyl-3-methyl-5-hydroxy-6-metoxy-1,4-benzoquinol methylase
MPYDTLICSETFTHGHLGPEAIDNLTSLVRPNGWCVIGVNNEHFEAREFDKKLSELIENHQLADLQIAKIQVYEPGSVHYGDQARVLIFRIK